MNKLIRLTESDLHEIIKESVKRILKETNHMTTNGGFDSYAYKYDNANKNAESLEDWDKMMANREKNAKMKGQIALNRHPQSTNKFTNHGIGASEYAHPEWFSRTNDDILNKIKADAEFGKREYGFPI